MFRRFQKLPIETEGDFIPIDIIGIKRDGVFRPLVWETVMTTHGEWAGRDENHRSAIESSAHLDQRNRLPALRGLWLCRSQTDCPVMKLIPVHNIVRCPRMAISTADQCIQPARQTQRNEKTETERPV